MYVSFQNSMQHASKTNEERHHLRVVSARSAQTKNKSRSFCRFVYSDFFKASPRTKMKKRRALPSRLSSVDFYYPLMLSSEQKDEQHYLL
jgi:hypothetical protein